MDLRTVLETAGPIVERRGKRAGINGADREDVLQDVIVKYLVAFSDEGPRNLAAWVERTTERLVIDRYRAARRHPQVAWPDQGEPDVISTLVAAWRDATATSLGAMKRLVLATALGLLSDSDRTVFERRYLEGESAADLAARLGVAVNTIDQRAGRARRRLKEALEQRPDLVTELAAPHPRAY